MTRDYASPDWRELCEELAGWIERSTRHYIQDPDVLIRARAALAEPELEVIGPTDEELLELYPATMVDQEDAFAFARAVLARWGRPAPAPAGERQAAPVPVAVADRLPGPEDCDAEGRVWWLGVDTWMLRSYALIDGTAIPLRSHWLPAHALPLPPTEPQP